VYTPHSEEELLMRISSPDYLCGQLWPALNIPDFQTAFANETFSQLFLLCNCRWKVYAPRSEEEVLRRDSSPDYSREDIGEPVLEVELQPGVGFLGSSISR